MSEKRWPWQKTWREIFADEGQKWLEVPEVRSVVTAAHQWHVTAHRNVELMEQGIDPRRDEKVNTAPRDLEDADVESWFDAAERNQREQRSRRRWRTWLT